MSADATLLDNDLRPRLQSLRARLARDGIVTALPPPSTIRSCWTSPRSASS